MNKTYLGDAVYVELSEYGDVVLTTENGIEATNTIILDSQVVNNLKLWLEETFK